MPQQIVSRRRCRSRRRTARAGRSGRHRRGRGAVHPDLAVPVQRHETPGGVDEQANDHGEVEAVPVGDLAPVGHRRTAPSGSAPMRTPCADRVDVDDVWQVVDVRAEEAVCRGRGPRPGERHPLDAREPVPDQLLYRAAIADVASVSAGPPCGGLAANPPSDGGLCEGDDDAVGQPGTGRAAAVGAQGSRGDTAGVGVAVAVVDQHGASLAASTSSALRPGRLESPWVSRPRNSGPSYPAHGGGRRSPASSRGCGSR